MKRETQRNWSDPHRLGVMFIGVVLAWMALLAGSLTWGIVNERRQVRELAWSDADAHFNKDQAFRLWAASHGGLYVTPSDDTPPNAYLTDVPDRNVVTTEGKKLTLMNPAYVLRKVMEDYEKLYGIKGRITSLKVLNPDNKPDPWERSALKAFDTGQSEVAETVTLDGQEHLRLMRPMLTTANCLKCHARQGYTVGQVRGGVSLAVPMAPYLKAAQPRLVFMAVSHGAIWAIGMVGITLAWRRLRRRLAERDRSREAMRQSEESLSITLDSIGDAVIATDTDGRIVRMNAVAERMTGWSIDDAIRRELSEVFHIVSAETRQPVDNPAAKVLAGGKTVGLANHTILIARDGAERQIADSGAPIRDRNGRVAGVVLVFRDVTEEYAIQEQVRHSQKMEAIGELAGGVAHDFNNLLTGIIGNTQLLAKRLDPQSKSAEFATRIEMASRRATSLARQLLDFSRKDKIRSVCVDLHEIIAEVVELLAHSIDKCIAITDVLTARAPHVMGDPDPIFNAILNLALNARDAMPDGGQLTLLTRNVLLDEAYCQLNSEDLVPGQYVEIALTDTGVGMSLETRKRIFEPFFTTKKRGKGTGMGLAVVHGVAAAHHGLVRVQSELGKGTTFKLLLPVAPADHSVKLVPRCPSPQAGHGHVLIVDDEEVVRTMAATALEELGYTVSTCLDGEEALDFFRQHHHDVDLVLLDLIMPRTNGQAVFAEMKNIQSNVRVIAISGFTQADTINTLLDAGVRGFVSKPFNIAELSHQVARHISPTDASRQAPAMSDPSAPSDSL